MSAYFFDSSALAKRYFIESGTQWVQNMVTAAPNIELGLAPIARIELVSALARKHRENLISQAGLTIVLAAIDHHFKHEYTVIEFSPPIERMATDLLLRYPLRASDALQLACAKAASIRVSYRMPFTFVCADVRLHAAAIQEGLTVDDPNNHP